MSEIKNIYQRINAVMAECPYLQKEKAQQGKGVKYDQVVAILRGLLIKHGIAVVVRQIEMDCLALVEGTKQKVYQGRYEMDLINIDNPAEIVTHSAYAHGMDGGDKAPGKAHTYAVKIMLTKGFLMDTGEDEESRAEVFATVTETQVKGIESLIGDDEEIKVRVLGWLSVESVSDILKSDYNKVVAQLKKAKSNESN